MAQYLTNINLTGNEIQNFVVQPLATAPTSLVKVGRKFFNSGEGREAIYDGKEWKLSAYMTDINTLGSSVSGIDTRLATIEEYFKTTEDAGEAIDKWNEIVEFLNATEGDTLDGILAAYTVNTRKIEGDGTTITGGGDLTEDRVLSLATSGVTAGTYTKVTVDKYGRVTSATTLAAGDIPTLAISKIDGLQAALDDRYTKKETDNLLAKYLLLTAATQTIKGDIRIEGNLVVTGDTTSGGEGGGASASGVTGIVVNGEIHYAENGLVTIPDYPTSLDWDSIEGKPTFASVATSGSYDDLTNKPVSLKNPNVLKFGTKTYDGSQVQTITAADLGALTEHQSLEGYATEDWVENKGYQVASGLGSLAFKDSLSKSDVGLGNVENTKLSTWAGTANIKTVGTITSGTWNGTKIANAYLANNSMTIAGTTVALGGTLSASDLATAMVGESLTKKYATAITKSTSTSYKITHSLNTRDVVVMVYDPSTFEQVMVDITMTDVNNVTLSFATAPSQNYKVVVVG